MVWTVVAIVVVAVATALVIASRVSVASASEFWKKIDHLEHLRQQPPFDAVFVGHSIPLCAVDPEVVAAASGGLRTYNASLSNLFFDAAAFWLTRFVIPSLRPRLVVLGLAGLEFNPHSTRMKVMEQYVRSQDVRAEFELANPIKRLRLLLTRPSLAKFLLRRFLRPAAKESTLLPADRSVFGPYGEERKHDDRTLMTSERLHEALRDGIFTDYEFSESEVTKLRNFIGDVRAAGCEVAIMGLVTMPNAVDYYPNGEKDYAVAWERARAVLAELNVELIEVDDSPYDETCFSDVMHMNRRGKAMYSQQIGGALRALLGPETSRV